MTTRIESKIVGYEVVTPESTVAPGQAKTAPESKPAETNVVHMHEKLERPEVLVGSTYKIKTPLTEHALYVTINDVVLNQDTPHEKRRPFEIFINSKSMDHFQWVVALTRVVSAVFRKGGDCTFLVEELHSVFDPKGGYFRKGKYVPSLVAELGDVIERHLKTIGMIVDDGADAAREQMIEEKRTEWNRRNGGNKDAGAGFPADAQGCNKCAARAVVRLDGCLTCLNCGDSKCG